MNKFLASPSLPSRCYSSNGVLVQRSREIHHPATVDRRTLVQTEPKLAPYNLRCSEPRIAVYIGAGFWTLDHVDSAEMRSVGQADLLLVCFNQASLPRLE